MNQFTYGNVSRKCLFIRCSWHKNNFKRLASLHFSHNCSSSSCTAGCKALLIKLINAADIDLLHSQIKSTKSPKATFFFYYFWQSTVHSIQTRSIKPWKKDIIHLKSNVFSLFLIIFIYLFFLALSYWSALSNNVPAGASERAFTPVLFTPAPNNKHDWTCWKSPLLATCSICSRPESEQQKPPADFALIFKKRYYSVKKRERMNCSSA